MSLRARLVLVTVVVVAGALLVANVAISGYVKSFLNDRTDEQLAGVGRGIPAAIAPSRLPRPANPGIAPGDLQLDDVFLAICGSDGTIVDSGFVFGSDKSKPSLPADVCRTRGTRTFDTAAADDTPYRVRVSDSAFGQGRIVVAQSSASTTDTLDSLLLVQLVASTAVLAAVLGLVWWLTGLALRPLRKIENTAAAIAGGDLSQRVEATNPRTEIGRLGDSLNGMLAEIEDAFAAKDTSERRLRQFVADASHELRTPLTTVRGYAELLERGVDGEERAIAIRRIVEHGTRMSELVDDLLVLARLDEGRPLAREDVDLVQLVAETVADAQALEHVRVISVRGPDQLISFADRDQVTQVLTNLMTNALVHTPADTTIEVEIEDHDGAARVAVVDHGSGIPPDLKARLFDRFVRADASRSRGSGGGSGLGLAIVAAIMDAHDGEYGADDTPGGGATIWVEFPRASV